MSFGMPDLSGLMKELGIEQPPPIEMLSLEQVLERIKKRQSFESCLISNMNLSGKNLSGLKFVQATFQGVILDGCDLSETEFQMAAMVQCSLKNATLRAPPGCSHRLSTATAPGPGSRNSAGPTLCS